MNFAKRSLYFVTGIALGSLIVLFIAVQKKVEFPYGPDARTLKSLRVKKHRYFSNQAKEQIQKYALDSLDIDVLLRKSDVDFSESITDRSLPCQTYKINGERSESLVSITVQRCDSSLVFEKILIAPNQ